MFSGRTMLSSAVWATYIALFLRRTGHVSIGIALGLASGALIGAARVFEEAHTVAAASLLLVSGIPYGHHAPFQSLIERYSPGVCARFLWASAQRFSKYWFI